MIIQHLTGRMGYKNHGITALSIKVYGKTDRKNT